MSDHGSDRPVGPPLMRMTWRSLLFMHWPVEVERLRPLVPPALEIDTFDGSAWVGLIPFTMRDVSPVLLPRIPLPGVADFHECNVRTYVRCPADGGVGVYFFSLDAASRVGVWAARRFFHLPYFNARMMLERDGDEVRYAVDRIDQPRGSLRCVWTVGGLGGLGGLRGLRGPLPKSQPGELAHFLTERYALYTVDDRGRTRRCRIAHEPWRLREATLRMLSDSLVAAAGISLPDSEPLLHHADEMKMHAWALEKV